MFERGARSSVVNTSEGYLTHMAAFRAFMLTTINKTTAPSTWMSSVTLQARSTHVTWMSSGAPTK